MDELFKMSKHLLKEHSSPVTKLSANASQFGEF